MSYKLEYPYTEQERIDFISQYSYQQKLKIKSIDNFVDVEFTYTEPDIDGEGETTRTEIKNVNRPTYYALEDNEIMVDGVPQVDPDYEEKKAQAERERIQELFMTRSDFFDGTIMAWGIGQDELLVLIQGLLATLPIENVKKLIAINNFKNALNFYRKHDLFKMLVNIPIPLTGTVQIILTDESLDKFFDEVNKGNKETAWQYLLQPVMLPVEEETIETESDTESTDV